MKIKARGVELRRVKASELSPHPQNWRQHPENQQNALRAALADIGYADALKVRQHNGGYQILDGHLRAETTPEMEVPVLVLDLDDDESKKLLATFDPLAGMAEANQDMLKGLLTEIELPDDLGAALDGLIDDKPEVKQDEVPEVQDEAVTKTGDVWKCGEHRVVCGDCTKSEDVAHAMQGEKAQLIQADPPYGMGKETDGVRNDNLYGDKLDAFQMSWWRKLRPHVEDNASAYIWGNAEDLWRLWYVGGLRDSERVTFRNELVWSKGVGQGQGSDAGRMYSYGSERCLFFMLGEQGFNNNADNYWEGFETIRSALAEDCKKMGWGRKDIGRICGVEMYSHWFTKSQWCLIPEEHYQKLQAAAREHDAFKREHDDLKREFYDLKREHDDLKREFYATRAHFDNTHDNMTDVWSFQKVGGEDRHGHPTPKPVSMISRAIKSSSDGGVVADPLLGSGTTLIAAHQLDRRCYGIEIEPRYVDVTLKRYLNLTGDSPIRESDGAKFTDLLDV